MKIMVVNCVAYGCNNLHDSRKHIPFHTFPFKRPDILKLWITAICRKIGCTVKRLKPDGVPSVFCFSKHLLKNDTLLNSSLMTEKNEPISNNVSELSVEIESQPSSPSEWIKQIKIFVDCETQTTTNNTLSVLRRKIKTLKQKVKRRDLKISKLKHIIKQISRNGDITFNLDAVLKNYFEEVVFPKEAML